MLPWRGWATGGPGSFSPVASSDDTDPHPGGRRGVLPVLQAVALAVIAVLPPFLTGALAVGIRTDLAFGPSALGLAIALYFVSSSLCSTVLGPLVERLGIRPSLVIGAVASATSLLGIGVAHRYAVLIGALLIGGAANAITQPAVGALLSQRIPNGRLGLAFGIKQSAIPGATLLGGLLVPTLAVLIGWRGTFLTMAIVAVLGGVAAFLGTKQQGPGVVRRRRRLRDIPEFRSLAILSLGGGIGSAAATSLGSFLVDSAVVSGIPEASAGLLIALASAFGLTSRIGLGWYADHRPTRSRYGGIGMLLFLGVPGYVLLSIGLPVTYVVGSIVAYGAGWAWAGLFHYAAVSQNPTAPAAATGVVQVGMSLGAGLGPLAFGVVAERVSYGAAWAMAATLSGLGGAIFLYGRAHLRRARRTASAARLSEVTALRWDDQDFRHVADGVQSQARTTDHLYVTVYRTNPGSSFDAPAPGRTGVVLNMGNEDVELHVAGIAQLCAGGDHLTLPAFRRWSVHNVGTSPATLAQVEHHGKGPSR